jgi:predicted negative regulator of RcsB-dependent stress response
LAQHILRKDLKKDEIRDSFVHGVESVASHQQLLYFIIGAALVVGLGVFGWNSYSQRQTAKAAAALDDAMKVFDARIRAPGENADPGEITYVDEKNKFADAETKFLAISSQYGRTRPGQLATYYSALSEIQLKKYDDAEKHLNEIVSAGDENLAGLARFQMAAVDDLTGRATQAADIYKQLVDKPTEFVPKSMVLLTLADHYRSSDPAQASKLYNQVKTDFPDTPAAQEADDGLELLNAKS